MKKFIHLALFCSLIVFNSCHTRKKLIDTQSLTDHSTISAVNTVRAVTDQQISHQDSSKTIRADSSTKKRTEKIDIEFSFDSARRIPPVKIDPVRVKDFDILNNLISQAIAQAGTVKMHIERTQEARSGTKETTQAAIKNTTNQKKDSTGTAKQLEKKNIKQASQHKDITTTPANGWIAAGILILLIAGFFLVKKFIL